MRLVWSPRALQQLEELSNFAPAQAARIVDAVEWLAGGPFPWMFPLLAGYATRHIFHPPATHHTVAYELRDDEFHVLSVRDVRRQ